jgi:hypothetical protein
VVQEAGLARECILFWGTHQLEFYHIMWIAYWFAYSIYAPYTEGSTLTGQTIIDVFTDIQLTYRNEPTWRTKALIVSSLEKFYPVEKQLYVDLLMTARFLEVSDQRDIIYSSLGSPLAFDQTGKLMVAPDYNESVHDLHIRAAHAFLQNPREASHVLLRVIHASKEDLNRDGYPTWVPRWYTLKSADAYPKLLTWTYEYRSKPYRASRGSKFCLEIEPGNILVVTGIIFDTISWISFVLKAPNFRSDIESWEPRFRDSKISAMETIWLELLNQSSRPPEELAYDMSLTISRGRPSSQNYAKDFPKNHYNDFLAYSELLRSLAGSEQPSPFPQPRPNQGVASEAEWGVARCRERRLAYTTESRLALVPLVAEVGDIFCVIQGMDVPVVLRKTRSGRYKFVGEAYVQGVMEGELMESTGSLKWETLRIV